MSSSVSQRPDPEVRSSTLTSKGSTDKVERLGAGVRDIGDDVLTCDDEVRTFGDEVRTLDDEGKRLPKNDRD